MERWRRWCWLGPECPPPRQQHAASSSSPEARHHLWSSRPVGAAGVLDSCSLAPGDGAWCPASAGRDHCGRGYAAGMQIPHLSG